jgi:hypothetical protein
VTNSEWGIGNKADAKPFDRTFLGDKEVDLIFGEHPHSRQDNNEYARLEDGTIHDFCGHRRLIDVEIKSSNYLKSSHLSGDEIRKSVIGSIFSDGKKVYEFFSREPDIALLRAYHLLQKLQSHESNWLSLDGRYALVGRKIYYHDQPATINAFIEDQGCVIIQSEPSFAPPRSNEEDELDYWSDWKRDDHYEIKDDVLSPHIWWFRK